MAAIPIESVTRTRQELYYFVEACKHCETVPDNVMTELHRAAKSLKSLENALREWVVREWVEEENS